MIKRPLDTGWTLSRIAAPSFSPPFPATLQATVPGVVHLDLLKANLIADPYLDVNEVSQDWIGRSEWRYEVEFDWQDEGFDRVDLVCLGLDTAATLLLNGAELGRTANMHRSYRFDLRPHLQAGANRLTIDFQSAYAHGAEVAQTLGEAAAIPANYPGPGHLIRKMACNFGWDWGPSLVTAGPWQPVLIESWSGARLASVRPQVTLVGGAGQVHLDCDLEWADGASDDMAVTVTIAGEAEHIGIPAGQTQATLALRVENPGIWWPAGIGEPALYLLEVELKTTAGESVDRWQRKTGFRSIRLDTTPDEIGSAFTLVVNDVPVFARGANWIPDDCFLPRVTPERYRARIKQAVEANMNILRVWGGGIYETDAFYEACDEAGIMVWQDFLFACAAYPEEEPVRGEVEAEAREAITRLMPYPSLVLWNGNNENIWGYFDWGWKDVLGNRAWGAGYYLDLLPKLVAEIDPTRPYYAGSPYSGTMDIAPNADEHGCKHIWDVWNDVGYEVYRHYKPRFCSEFGWQAPPTYATIRQSMREEKITLASPGLNHHQKATTGNDKLLRGLKGWFPEPQIFDDWLWATQLNQARAIALGVEHMRSLKPVCMGSIVWQLNDCWPVTSWSAIDGYGRRKPLWYALQHCYAPHLLTIQPRDGALVVAAVNETTLFWRVPFSVERIDFDGKVLAHHAVWRVLCDRGEKVEIAIPTDVATSGDPCRELLRARLGKAEALWFFERDEQLAYPAPRFDLATENAGEDVAVMVTAKTLLRDFSLFVDRLAPDAEVDDMLVTLLPGETRRFVVRGLPDADATTLARVARTANDLVRR